MPNHRYKTCFMTLEFEGVLEMRRRSKPPFVDSYYYRIYKSRFDVPTYLDVFFTLLSSHSESPLRLLAEVWIRFPEPHR
jgi:hypothetical protein